MSDDRIVIVGGGIFGLTAAGELSTRGHAVTLVEAGSVPNPLAASTDISKVVRMEYGADADYMEMAEEARTGWLEWNDTWKAAGHEALYHDTGVVMCCMREMAAGGFEHDSYGLLLHRGHKPVRLDAADLVKRFPAWRSGRFVDGFFHGKGGYVESGSVLTRLTNDLRKSANVRLIENAPVQELLFSGDACVGVLLRDGRRIESDHVVVAAGAWTSKLYPELSAAVRPTGHPVFHLRPKTASLFESIRFPTFTADVARTGYYGFPLNRDGVVKIGVHGVGIDIDPDATRTVAAEQVAHMRQFLGIAFPDLVDAELVYTRLCLYTDTPGEDFVIDSHPNLRGVTVSSGGSGHGFKFGPVLGALTADAVEGKPPRYGQKFSWLRFVAGNQPPAGAEAARCHDPIDLVH